MDSLYNGSLAIEISEVGAELQSIRLGGLEYLWNGDPLYWAGRSPLLFPIVGVQKDGFYTYQGKKYEIMPHGFAKTQVFNVEQPDESSLVFTLHDNAATRALYPFSFALETRYSLSGNQVRVSHRVTNHSSETMPFSIGEHVGLRVPLLPGESYGDYRLRFAEKETASYFPVVNRAVASEGTSYLNHEDVIHLREDMFENGPIILKHLKSTRVELAHPENGHSVTMDFPGYDYFALWAAPKAPFLCLEPWNGIGSGVGGGHELIHKEGIRLLQSGETYECGYGLTIQ